MPKNAQSTAQLHSSHPLAKLMLKILQARLQQYVNHELPDVQAGIRKARGTRDQIGNIHGSSKKQDSSRNDYAKALVKEESEKVDLKLNIQKTKIMACDPITSWQIDMETVDRVTDFIFLGSKITADGDCSHEIKRFLLFGRKASGSSWFMYC